MKLLMKWIEPTLVAAVLLFVPAGGYGQVVKGTYITTADTQVRKGPGPNHPVITAIPKDIKINVVGKEGAWLKIESKHGNQPGYIEEKYARPLEAKAAAASKSAPSVAGTYRTITEVDLREGPGTQHRIMQKLPEGIKVNVVRAEGDWLRIESKRGNRPGYVEKRFMERVVD